MLTIELIIYYGSYLAFPLFYWVIKRRNYLFIFLGIIFIYSRFIEPKIVVVNHYKIEVGFKARYALVSDIHLGLYNDETILKKVVERVNEQDIDALLIAGDFTYDPDMKKLEQLFAPLQKINVPIYAVLGNHDMQSPGPKLDRELVAVLEKFGVNVIDNRAITLGDVTILGLGSHRANDDEIALINHYREDENLVVLTHNPDTTLDYPQNHTADVTLVGHTHGGQVRVPWLYHYFIPVSGEVPWNQGEYNYKHHKVFVTSGVGMIGFPFRFLIPPVVDVLEFY